MTGEPLRYIGTNQDRSVEARSHETERLLSQIVMSTSEAIYTVDLRAARAHPGTLAAERLYGYTAEEMIGQSLRLLYPETATAAAGRSARSGANAPARR